MADSQRTPKDRRAYNKAYRQKHAARLSVLNAQWRKKNRDRHLANVKAWRQRHAHRRQWYHLKNKYGVTPDRYAALLALQGGVCLLCQKPPKKRLLYIDHDHETGEIRALLHSACNSVLRGCFGDKPSAMRDAAERFERFRDETASHRAVSSGFEGYPWQKPA